MNKQFLDMDEVDSFVRDALRSLLSSHQGYLRSTKDNVLTPTDIVGAVFSMEDIGYRSVRRGNIETWNTGTQCIGYLAKDNRYILLSSLLMDILKREAIKRDIILPLSSVMIDTLINMGMLIPTRDTTRYVMPISSLFPDVEIEDKEHTEK